MHGASPVPHTSERMHLTRSVVVLFAAILIAQTFGPIAHAAAGAPRAAAPPVAHPNINPATLVVGREDFMKFLEVCGNQVQYVSVAPL